MKQNMSKSFHKCVCVGIWVPAHLGLKNWLPVPPGKATILTDHLLRSEPALGKVWFKSNHTYKPFWLSLVVLFEALLDVMRS